MVVGGGMAREVAAHETGVLVDRSEPALAQAPAGAVREQLRPGAARELPGDRPVDQADRGLERAAPVRPPPVRAGVEPTREVLPQDLQVFRIAAECVCLREGHQVKMAVQLPEILDLPDPAAIA